MFSYSFIMYQNQVALFFTFLYFFSKGRLQNKKKVFHLFLHTTLKNEKIYYCFPKAFNLICDFFKVTVK